MITKDLHGIVFNTFNYKENDLIVDILTPEHGFIQLYVRGAQKTTSKSFFIFKLFNRITFDVSKLDLDNLSLYKSGSVIKIFDYTNLDYQQMSISMLITELLFKIRKTRDINLGRYYECLVKTLDEISDKKLTSQYILNHFIVRTLEVLGCPLQLDSCLSCQKQSNICAFSLEYYGFVCQDCLDSESEYLKDEEILKYLYYLNKDEFYEVSQAKEKEVLELLLSLLNDNVGIYLVAAKYI